MGSLKLLFAGDLHIGRSSSGVGAGSGIELRAREYWERIVQPAIANEVDLVCLTGVVMDGSIQLWEARGMLEAEIDRPLKALER